MQYLKNYPFSWGAIVAIFVLCLMPVPHKQMPSVPNFDKLVHSGLYLVLCSIILWERLRLARIRPLQTSHCFVGAFVLPIMMSGLIELMQAYCTTNRSGDWWDMAANTLGVVVAWIVFVCVRKRYFAL